MRLLSSFFKLKNRLFPDRNFRRPRIWSNRELKKIAPLFDGNVINVSGWRDNDKEGGSYRDYFYNARSYTISNCEGKSGFQGDIKNEIFIDLEKELPDSLKNKYDIVFNHTTLEHVFDIFSAFRNLCGLSRDIVIIVIPFIQKLHISEGDYSDYWRFSPYAIEKFFKMNNMEIAYISANKGKESVYILAVASKKPENWKGKFPQVNRSIYKDLGKGIF